MIRRMPNTRLLPIAPVMVLFLPPTSSVFSGLVPFCLSTPYPSRHFGTGSWPFFQRQNQKATKGVGVSRRKPGCERDAGRWITLPVATIGSHASQH